MALLFTSGSSIVFPETLKPLLHSSPFSVKTRSIVYRLDPNRPLVLTTTIAKHRITRFPPLISHSSVSGSTPDPEDDPYQTSNRKSEQNPSYPSPASVSDDDEWGEESASITDEWAEKTGPQPEYTRFSDPDPPRNEDEWEEEYASVLNGTPATGKSAVVEDRLGDLKRCLVDTVYGTDLGFRVSPEVRGEVLELVNQLEASNPIPAPVEATHILDGNWILL